jgi:hypothetical protein
VTTSAHAHAGIAIAAASPRRSRQAAPVPAKRTQLMDTHARLIAFALQIALNGAVIVISLWLSPATAVTLSPPYPVDATIFAIRAMLSKLARALRQRG